MKVIQLLAETEQKGILDSATRTVLERQKELQSNAGNGGIGDKQTAEQGATVEISGESMQKYLDMMVAQQNAEVANQQGEAMKDAVEDMGKIMVIFRRICHGDIVPPQDEKKLMEYSDEMYQAAKVAATMAKNDDPKKYKSVDEGKKEEKTAASDGLESAASFAQDVVEIAESSAEAGAEMSGSEMEA